MPFTFSHPAIVLPLTLLPKSWISVTGLIIGSIVPDFEKFFKMAPHNTFSHTWQAIFWFNIPVAFFLCFVFHLIVRNPLIENLPDFLRLRFSRYVSFDWLAHIKTSLPIVILSIFLGTVSHIFWDSITHSESIIVRHFSILSERIYFLHAYVPVYKIVDRLSSVAGGILILIFILKLPKDKILLKRKRMINPYWALMALIFIIVFGLRFLAGWSLYFNIELIISVISAALISLIIAPLLLKVIHK